MLSGFTCCRIWGCVFFLLVDGPQTLRQAQTEVVVPVQRSPNGAQVAAGAALSGDRFVDTLCGVVSKRAKWNRSALQLRLAPYTLRFHTGLRFLEAPCGEIHDSFNMSSRLGSICTPDEQATHGLKLEQTSHLAGKLASGSWFESICPCCVRRVISNDMFAARC